MRQKSKTPTLVAPLAIRPLGRDLPSNDTTIQTQPSIHAFHPQAATSHQKPRHPQYSGVRIEQTYRTSHTAYPPQCFVRLTCVSVFSCFSYLTFRFNVEFSTAPPGLRTPSTTPHCCQYAADRPSHLRSAPAPPSPCPALPRPASPRPNSCHLPRDRALLERHALALEPLQHHRQLHVHHAHARGPQPKPVHGGKHHLGASQP